MVGQGGDSDILGLASNEENLAMALLFTVLSFVLAAPLCRQASGWDAARLGPVWVHVTGAGPHRAGVAQHRRLRL